MDGEESKKAQAGLVHSKYENVSRKLFFPFTNLLQSFCVYLTINSAFLGYHSDRAVETEW